MKKALLIIFGPTDGTEMLRVAGLLKGGGECQPEVLFCANYNVLAERLDFSNLANVAVYDMNGLVARPSITSVVQNAVQAVPAASPIAAQAPRPGKLQIIAHLLMRPARKIFAISAKLKAICQRIASATLPGKVFNELAEIKRQNRLSAELLDRHKPDLLILPLEALGHLSANLAAAASDRGIPCVIVPYTVPVNIGEICERWCERIYYEKYGMNSLINRFVARRYPQWVYEYRGKKLLRLTAPQIFACECAGMAPRQPWKAGGLQYSEMIAVENEAMHDYYVKEGYPPEKLRITGTMADDMLASGLADAGRRHDEICRELGMDKNKPILLTSMPPDFAHRESCQFKTFSDLVEFWTKTLVSLGKYNVIVRLHPSLSYEELRHIEQWGARISRRDTAWLMPVCRIFVTTVSSTIRWAIACGIPVVNYDVYGFHYEDFAKAGGVLMMDSSEEFARTLKRLVDDPQFYDQTAERQRAVADRWGNLDGRTGHRLIKMFDDALSDARNPADLLHRRRRRAFFG